MRRGAPQIIGEDPSLRKVFVGAAARRRDRHDRAARRRERHRQGAVRARAARAQPARRRAVCRHQLRRDSRERCSRPSCSATRRARSPAPSARKPGKFELAHRGTLFLDEIGELPLSLQAKILRALEEKALRARRRHGARSRSTCASWPRPTASCSAAVAARQFREDLYFRLSVFPITIPPLRERPGDIPMLARYFIERFCRDLNKTPLDAVARRRSRRCRRTAGRATCASCRTASSAR